MKHYNIPIFLPELACPYRCVYCNQFCITGKQRLPDIQDVKNIIERHLATFSSKDRMVEVAFFGGNFTGLPETLQDDFLKVVQPFLDKGAIDGIRCSTRPDYIDEKRVKILKSYGMRNIELGAQTTNDDILRKCGRGHTYQDIENASKIITSEGVTLGLQMMLGLPFDTFENDLQTARDIVRLGAGETRIYPCVVVKDTELEQMYRAGKYTPLSMKDAVEQSATIYEYFTANNVKVLRVGLHTSEDLDNEAFVAGPYHNNFADMVFSKIWGRKIDSAIESIRHGNGTISDDLNVKMINKSSILIEVTDNQMPHAVGYKSENKYKLENVYKSVTYKTLHSPLPTLKTIIASATMPVEAREKLETLGDVIWLELSGLAYPSISSHPDIFFFCDNEKDCKSIVYASNTPQEWLDKIKSHVNKEWLDTCFIEGAQRIGGKYPETVPYNAVGIGDTLIHNLQFSDEKLLTKSLQINVNQGYTRCNLLALNERNFITSDLGIKKTLEKHGYDVFYVDPQQITLSGQKYGFFPGCCGLLDDNVVVCGSLNHLREGKELKKFIRRNKMKIIELYNGKLIDVGSMFFIKEPKTTYLCKHEKN